METCLLCPNHCQPNKETNSFGEQTTVTQCYGKALINFPGTVLFYLFVCLVFLGCVCCCPVLQDEGVSCRVE